MYKQKIEDVDRKIPNTSGLVKETDYNAKFREIENKIASVTGLVTTAALNAKNTKIQNKIHYINNTKAALNVNGTEIEGKICGNSNLTTKASLKRLNIKHLIPPLLLLFNSSYINGRIHFVDDGS